MLDIDIRPILTPADLAQLADIQQLTRPTATLSPQFMQNTARNGGLLLGAYEGSALRGFAFGMLGLVDDAGRIDSVAAARLKLFLERMDVHPDHQNRGVGYELMVGVRLYAVRIGLRFVSGSFDLLNSQHGWLYISKLGGVVSTYEPAQNATTADSQDSIMATLDWWVANNRVKRRTMQPRKPLKLRAFLQGGGVIVNTSTLNAANLAVPMDGFDSADNNILLAEIPVNFDTIIQKDSALATAWRTHIHQLFSHYFERGYFVTDFVYHRGDVDVERAYYVLAHQDANLLSSS